MIIPKFDWKSYLSEIEPIKDPGNLPDYAYQFLFSNLGKFKSPFLFVTVVSTLATTIRFFVIYALSDIISQFDKLSFEDIYAWYLPLTFFSLIIPELLDYYIRRDGESLPVLYGEHLTLRFLRTWAETRSPALWNFSKERLITLVAKYISHVRELLSSWAWEIIPRLTRLIIIILILFFQSPLILLVNCIIILGYLSLSFYFSKKITPIAREYSEASFDSDSALSGFFLAISSIQRLQAVQFILNRSKILVSKTWERFINLREFHARRWVIQLCIYHTLSVGTTFAGIYQASQGYLGIGYIVLIRWAFTELWLVLVFMIEYVVRLATQRQDALLVRREISLLLNKTNECRNFAEVPREWSQIVFRDTVAVLDAARDLDRPVSIKVPALSIVKGSKIGIVGESGQGKTTILNMLCGIIPYSGDLLYDGVQLAEYSEMPSWISVTTSVDPLFKLSLRDNILLGKEIDEARLLEILEGLQITKFAPHLESLIGQRTMHLSLGQEQRIRLARGLAQDASLYLLDEPFSGLDVATRNQIMSFLSQFLKDKTLILVTHNHDELSLVDVVYEMKGGVLMNPTSPHTL